MLNSRGRWQQQSEIIARNSTLYGEHNNEMVKVKCSIFFALIHLQSYAIAYGSLDDSKKRYGEEEKIEICVSDAWNCRSFFILPIMYIYLKIFNASFRVGMHFMEHYFCAHRFILPMCSVRSQEYGSWVQFQISQNMHFNIWNSQKSGRKAPALPLPETEKNCTNTGTGNERKCGTVPESMQWHQIGLSSVGGRKTSFFRCGSEEKNYNDPGTHELVHIRQPSGNEEGGIFL